MPDVNQVKLVNTALAQLGQEPVADLGDASLGASNAAVKIMRVIETSRETVLRRHGWECALSYVTLSPMANPPQNFRYKTAFQTPGDFLRVWEVQNPWLDLASTTVIPPDDWGLAALFPGATMPEERWQVNTVETNIGAYDVIWLYDQLKQLNLVYVRRASWGAMDPHVADAVAYDAAARAAFAVTGDIQLAAKLEKAAEAKVLMAISVDGTQEGGQPTLAASIPAAIRAYSRC